MSNSLNIVGTSGTDGNIPIGSTLNGYGTWTTLTPGTGIGIGNGSSTVTISASASTPLSFPTDAGTATPALNALTVAGAHNINTTGAGSTVTVQNNNTATFGDLAVVTAGNASMTLTSGDLLLSGTGLNASANIRIPAYVDNVSQSGTIQTTGGVPLFVAAQAGSTWAGYNAGNFTYSGTDNTGYGSSVLNSITTASNNCCIGTNSGTNLTTGGSNVLIGRNTMIGVGAIGASGNVVIGTNTLSNAGFNGNYNVVIQANVIGQILYNSVEASNVLIQNVGVALESNTLRLGTTGAGNGQQNRCFIAGIDGVDVGSVAKVLTMASGQVGTATITAGTNVTVTAGANTITIAANTASIVSNYVEVLFAASPYSALSTDYYISADTAGGAITIRLPNAPSTGRTFVVKDQVGNAAAVNVTVTTVGGVVNIDGATSFVMNANYQSASFVFGGAAYEVF